jgi:hypothetical protein
MESGYLFSVYKDALKTSKTGMEPVKSKRAVELTKFLKSVLPNSMLYYIRVVSVYYQRKSPSLEADVMRRIWQAIDTVFGSSIIDYRCGEMSSHASSDSRNQARTLPRHH